MKNTDHVPVENEDEDLTDWVLPVEIEEENPNIRKQKVDNDIRQRKHNGLEEAGAVLRFGKPHLIHKRRYARWLASKARGVA